MPLAFSEQPRSVVVAKRVTLVSLAVGVLALSWLVALMGFGLAVDESHREVRYATSKDGYFVFAPVQSGGHERIVSGAYSVSPSGAPGSPPSWMPPERILVTRASDVPRLLAGEAPRHVALSWPGDAGWVDPGPFGGGNFAFEPPVADCPPPTGGCIPESRPVLVFLRGSGWVGTAPGALTRAAIDYQDDTGYGGDAPVTVRMVWSVGGATQAAPTLLAVSWGAAAVGALAAIYWLFAGLRAAPAPHAAARPVGPASAATEDMLRLVRLGEIYVAGIRRNLAFSGVGILVAAVVLGVVALPLLYDTIDAFFRFQETLLMLATITYAFAIPALAVFALAYWLDAYVRTRRHLRAWSALSRELQDETDALLAA